VKPPIEIGDEGWICADAFLGPNVKVGNRAVVGAASVVVKNCNAGFIYGGNPAKKIKER
jgi:putative colanic acid biosynthesis acetyltransferase WcaF